MAFRFIIQDVATCDFVLLIYFLRNANVACCVGEACCRLVIAKR
jgi:hypothetical protein